MIIWIFGHFTNLKIFKGSHKIEFTLHFLAAKVAEPMSCIPKYFVAAKQKQKGQLPHLEDPSNLGE